jgi:hypothetical protein
LIRRFLQHRDQPGNDNVVEAGAIPATSVGNLALNLGQGTFINASGSFYTGISVGGNRPFTDNRLTAVGTFASAYNFFGNKNVVTAGPGPFATAASIAHTGAHITKTGPGININGGVVIGGAAAPAKAATTVKAAAVAGGKKRSTGSAVVAKHASK